MAGTRVTIASARIIQRLEARVAELEEQARDPVSLCAGLSALGVPDAALLPILKWAADELAAMRDPPPPPASSPRRKAAAKKAPKKAPKARASKKKATKRARPSKRGTKKNVKKKTSKKDE